MSSASTRPEPLKARAFMRPYALAYLYRRRLRVHAVRELLAGAGVAIAVALVFATTVASSSVAGSAREVVRAVAGPANLQLRARSADGFDEALLPRVEALPGVKLAAPLLEQTATILGAEGRHVTVDLAGTDASLIFLDGLAHTLPISASSTGGIGISRASASQLDISGSGASGLPRVLLSLRGGTTSLKVSAVLGSQAFGALSQAQVAVMPIKQLQTLAGLKGRVSRILVESYPGKEAAVRSELERLAGKTLTIAPTDEDVSLLHQALRPSDQASGFFAAISALLGFLFAFNALLLTVPERRQAIADLRLNGTKRSAIVQMVLFQGLCLGLAGSLVGLLAGYVLSLEVFHQPTRYLAEAFTLGTHTIVGLRPLLLSVIGGVIATCVASAVPLLDLRKGRTLDAVYSEEGVPGNALSRRAQLRLALSASVLLAATTALFVLQPSLALLASALLALATVLAVPLVLAGVLRAARTLSEHRQRMTILPVALTSLRATTLRSLALAITGAVALFGSVALGGARGDLLRGISGFAHSYAADASIWVSIPGDNQATNDFRDDNDQARLSRIPGVTRVETFQGGFLQVGDRRVWIIARPPGAARDVLDTQVLTGGASSAVRRLGSGGWITVSKQIAEEHHIAVGGLLTLQTPTGNASFRIAATTTNLAWIPGVVFIGSSDYRRWWASTLPTALAVQLAPGASLQKVQHEVEGAVGPGSGLEVSSAHFREASIDALTSEGLSQLGEISTLLLLAAILAMAAALTSAIWERRISLAGLRLSGVRPHRLRRILLVEAALMLGAGCVTGAIAGIYGQVVIDGYLEHVTGFPVARLGASLRPLEIFALVIAVVLVIVAIPGWFASRVSPTVALNES